MDSIVCKGIVIRQTNYAEADRILTIFTEELGIVHAMAKGARKYRSHQGAAAQMLCYGQFTLVRGKNLYTLRGAATLESFYGVSGNIGKLALATYLCDITHTFVAEASIEPDILRLLLNTLYLLANKDRPLALIKAVYELRLLALAGFGVETRSCVRCGRQGANAGFSVQEGGTVCGLCLSAASDGLQLPSGALAAMDYILHQPIERIFSFEVPREVFEVVANLAQGLVLLHAERDFYSLSYYQNVVGLDT